jgi:hypothetical protein
LLFQFALTAGGEWYIVGSRITSANDIETGQAGIVSDVSGGPVPTGIAEDLPFIGKAPLRIVAPQPSDADLLAAACPMPSSTFSP